MAGLEEFSTDYVIYDISGVDFLLFGDDLSIRNLIEHLTSSSEDVDQKPKEYKVCMLPPNFFDDPEEEVPTFSVSEEASLSSQPANKNIEELDLAHGESSSSTAEVKLHGSCEIGNDEKCKRFVEDSTCENIDSEDSEEIKIGNSPEYSEDSSVESSAVSVTKSSSLNNPFIDKGLDELNMEYEENTTETRQIKKRECKIGSFLKKLRDKKNEEKCKRFLESHFCSNLIDTQEQDHNYGSSSEKQPNVPSSEEVCQSVVVKSSSSTLKIPQLLDHNYAKPFEEKEVKASIDMSPPKLFCECLIEKFSEQFFTCNCGYQNLNEVVLQTSTHSTASVDSLCGKKSISKDHDISNEKLVVDVRTRKKRSPSEKSLKKSDLDIPRCNYSDLDSISLNSEDILLSFSNSELLDSDSGCSICSNSIQDCSKYKDGKHLSYNNDDLYLLSKALQNSSGEKTDNTPSLNSKCSEEREDKSLANLMSFSVNSTSKPFTIYDTSKQKIFKNWETLRKHNSNCSDLISFNSLYKESLLKVSNSNCQSDASSFILSSEPFREKIFPVYSNSFREVNISENNSNSSNQSNLSLDLSNNSFFKTHSMARLKHFKSSLSSLSSNIPSSESLQSLFANISENPLVKSSTYFQFYNLDLEGSNTTGSSNECHPLNSSLAIEELRKFEKMTQNLSSPLEETSLQFSLENSSELKNSFTASENSFSDTSSDEYYTCREFEESVIYDGHFNSSTPCKISPTNFPDIKEGSKREDFDFMEKRELFPHSLSQ